MLRRRIFLNNQKLLWLVIISFVLVTLMFDSGGILLGEIRYWSLLEVKELIEIKCFCEWAVCLVKLDSV